MTNSDDKNIIPRAYYQGSCEDFLSASVAEIHSELVHHSLQFDLTAFQEMAWDEEIRILKNIMSELNEGYIAFEYSIPRMGKRIDAVLIIRSCVILLEFKVGETSYPKNAVDQVVDYAFDLRNFHEESHLAHLFPFLVCTKASATNNEIIIEDNISSPIFCSESNLLKEILNIIENYDNGIVINSKQWINSIYKPTPTIIEAAQALYSGHDVQEISHKESDENDIAVTTARIDKIIEDSKKNHWKSICFVTGVPGAGKTLVGLNIANRRHRFKKEEEEHAVFLSGNEPLVTVLTEALARDRFEKNKLHCSKCKLGETKKDCTNCKLARNKRECLSETKSFIQMVHWFRDESLLAGHPAPIDKIAIFDEAQRAWNKEQLSKFMLNKKGQSNFLMSESECLIEYMNRHKDWAVIVCLVGGGQEIHNGEAGITEWFNAINNNFTSWKVFCSDRMEGYEYVGTSSIDELLSDAEVYKCPELHLSVSMRSFRSELVSAFAKALIDGDEKTAKELYQKITQIDPVTKRMRYPILLTRNLQTAKYWVKSISHGSERYGIIASSGAKRLRADGVTVPKNIEVKKWFLNGKEDVDSSYFMEVAASEFKIQGLEIDYAVVAWEADYRYFVDEFTYNKFEGNWKKVKDPIAQSYLKNTYRVLLTRARQGFIIYVPEGSIEDCTRNPEYYNYTYDYLKRIGIKEI